MSKVEKTSKTHNTVTIVKRFYPSGWYMIPFNILSVMVSWYFNKSIFWAIVHWIFAIPNLIYRLLNGSFKDGGFMQIVESYF